MTNEVWNLAPKELKALFSCCSSCGAYIYGINCASDCFIRSCKTFLFCRRNLTALECVTSQLIANQNEVEVEVNFGNLRKLVPEKFIYEKDPDISMIAPKKTILR